MRLQRTIKATHICYQRKSSAVLLCQRHASGPLAVMQHSPCMTCCVIFIVSTPPLTLHLHCLLAGVQQVRIGTTEAVLPLMLQRLLAVRAPGTPFICIMLLV